MAARAGRAINMCLTLRNWAIGCYIVEYEQAGADRALYGEKLLQKLSEELKRSGAVKYHPRELGRCRMFYSTYPQIRGAVSPNFNKTLPGGSGKGEGWAPSPEFSVGERK